MLCGAVEGLLDECRGLSRHTKTAVFQTGLYIFRGLPDQRDLDIVNRSRAIRRDTRDNPPLHQVNDHRAQATLDDMRAHTEDNRTLGLAGAHQGGNNNAQILTKENMWQGVDKLLK